MSIDSISNQINLLNTALEEKNIDSTKVHEHMQKFTRFLQNTSINKMSGDELKNTRFMIQKLNNFMNGSEETQKSPEGRLAFVSNKIQKIVAKHDLFDLEFQRLKGILNHKLIKAIKSKDSEYLLYITTLFPNDKKRNQDWNIVLSTLSRNFSSDEKKNLLKGCIGKASTPEEFSLVINATKVLATPNTKLEYYEQICSAAKEKLSGEDLSCFFLNCIDEGLENHNFFLIKLADHIILSNELSNDDVALANIIKKLPDTKRKDLFEKYLSIDLEENIEVYTRRVQTMLKAALECKDFAAALSFVKEMPNESFRENLWNTIKHALSENDLESFFSICLDKSIVVEAIKMLNLNAEQENAVLTTILKNSNLEEDALPATNVASETIDIEKTISLLTKSVHKHLEVEDLVTASKNMDKIIEEMKVSNYTDDQKQQVDNLLKQIIKTAQDLNDDPKEIAFHSLLGIVNPSLKASLIRPVIDQALKQGNFSVATEVAMNATNPEESNKLLLLIVNTALKKKDFFSASLAVEEISIQGASRSPSVNDDFVSVDGTDSEASFLSFTPTEKEDLFLEIKKQASENGDFTVVKRIERMLKKGI